MVGFPKSSHNWLAPGINSFLPSSKIQGANISKKVLYDFVCHMSRKTAEQNINAGAVDIQHVTCTGLSHTL